MGQPPSDPKATVVASLNVARSRSGERLAISQQMEQVTSWVDRIKGRADFILIQGACSQKSCVPRRGKSQTNKIISDYLLEVNMDVSESQTDGSKTFGLITAARMPILKEWYFEFKTQGKDKLKQGVVLVLSQGFIVGNVAFSATEGDGYKTRKRQLLELMDFYNTALQQACAKGFDVEGSVIGGNWCIDSFGDDTSSLEYRWLVSIMDQLELRDVWTETGHPAGGAFGDEFCIEGATTLPGGRKAKGSRTNMLFTNAVVETAAVYFPRVCKDAEFFSVNEKDRPLTTRTQTIETTSSIGPSTSTPCVSNNSALYARLHKRQVVASALCKSVAFESPTSHEQRTESTAEANSADFKQDNKDTCAISTDTLVIEKKSPASSTESSGKSRRVSAPRRRIMFNQLADESGLVADFDSTVTLARRPGPIVSDQSENKPSGGQTSRSAL